MFCLLSAQSEGLPRTPPTRHISPSFTHSRRAQLSALLRVQGCLLRGLSSSVGAQALFPVLFCSRHIVIQLLSPIRLFETPWTGVSQASLFFTISESLLKFMSVESVIPSNHLILCHPLLLLPSTFPSIRSFPSESALHI